MFFKIYRQLDAMDCGPACLRMIARYHGRKFNLRTLSKLCGFNREGVSLLGLTDGAEQIGLQSLGVKLTIQQLKAAGLPCILYWQQNHFVVLYKIKGRNFYIADPAKGRIKLREDDFRNSWQNNDELGIALVLSPTPQFYEQADERGSELKWSFLFRYLNTYRKLVFQLIVGLGIGSALQLITPFLTQAIVDVGINTKNLNFIYIILCAQIALIIGRISVEFIKSWILLHISTRINIAILTDFLIKLMKLPMGFFDTKMTGDIMERMNDQKKIENFLTGTALTTFFSVFNLLIFSIVLAYYNFVIFTVFVASSMFYTVWIVIFLKQRRILNYKSFEVSADNQSSVVQLINGMQEIKLNNREQQKRWEWERIQVRLFNFSVKSLALSQYQQGGATFINEGRNILITFLSAESVVQGHLTLGAMVAIQLIVGQLSSPVEQLLGFIQGFQDAKISLERLNEIHEMNDEEADDNDWEYNLPENKNLNLSTITFRYPGAGNQPVLSDIDLFIPQGKTTAIVGMSGSGKTTILKLLLRFYEPERGVITVGKNPIDNISFTTWRSQCGAVMQDGFIFSDNIERNITVGDEKTDKLKLDHAIKVANLQDFIDDLPLGLNTKIGAEGNGVSQGQRQRILIARAVYKDPHYIFFDEATNSLDANNERVIMNNLSEFFLGRTVLIVAHRLSTVKHADNIVVLSKGQIIEQGNHQSLTSKKGHYYDLVKNQLELGS